MLLVYLYHLRSGSGRLELQNHLNQRDTSEFLIFCEGIVRNSALIDSFLVWVC